MAGRFLSVVALTAALALLPGLASAAGGGGGAGAGGGGGGAGAGAGGEGGVGGADGTGFAAADYTGEAQFARGEQAVDAEDWDLAIFYFWKVIALDPENADAQNWLGFAYRKNRDFDNAFEHYKLALSIDPDHKGAHEYIGEAYLESGNLALAEQHLAALNKICPGGCEELEDLEEFIAEYQDKG